MAGMGGQGDLPPDGACDAAGFAEAMRRLKERSGLTFRQLEERAARSGDVLARSTLADTLRRRTLPRPEVLAAFVRACGEGDRVGVWLKARERVAAQAAAEATGTVPGAQAGGGAPATGDDARAGTADRVRTGAASDHAAEAESGPGGVVGGGVAAEGRAADAAAGGPPARPAQHRARRRTIALTAVLAPLLALVAWRLLPDGSGSPGASGGPDVSGIPVGWVTIRPARTPSLCLTDGRDRKGAYANAIAVQLPCVQATVPRTYLEPAGAGLYRIQWHHPQEGKGCLTVMSTGPVKGMLEPRNDCGRATLFRVEATAAGSARRFRLRPANSSRCIGIAGDDTAAGAEAVEERCTGAADQRFLIRAD
jgi:hypothetical protein